jgi:hypothetical protein
VGSEERLDLRPILSIADQRDFFHSSFPLCFCQDMLFSLEVKGCVSRGVGDIVDAAFFGGLYASL